MTYIAGVFDIRKRDALAFVAHVIEIAPDQFSKERCTDGCIRIVPDPRRDGSQFEAVALSVTGAFRSFDRTVPHNDAAARVSGGDQTVGDRADNIVMSGEQFSPGSGNLDPDLVVRSNQRTP